MWKFIRDVYTVSYWMWKFIKDGNTVSFELDMEVYKRRIQGFILCKWM